MKQPDLSRLYQSWEKLDKELRDPNEALGAWADLRDVGVEQMEYRITGPWWDVIQELDLVILITREYEHLLMAISYDKKTGPDISIIRMPHPSGLVVDMQRNRVCVACTRNPNQIYELKPVNSLMARYDMVDQTPVGRPLIPTRISMLPGCLYIHDLALVGGQLYATSVGQNAIVQIDDSGDFTPVWWPECIETQDGPILERNHLQLNSIAAGESLERSYYSASTDEVTSVVPGDLDFPVDKRGVIFSGLTRKPIARGLTRPHSARLHNDNIWVNNSGYGEVGFINGDSFSVVRKLSGWTRGLSFHGSRTFVGTSRVLPRFRQYAPGLELESSVCGVHIVDIGKGTVEASIEWPYGSQIFSVEWAPRSFTTGLPFHVGAEATHDKERQLFYTFKLPQP